MPHPDIAHPFGNPPGNANYERIPGSQPIGKGCSGGVPVRCVETTLDWRVLGLYMLDHFQKQSATDGSKSFQELALKGRKNHANPEKRRIRDPGSFRLSFFFKFFRISEYIIPSFFCFSFFSQCFYMLGDSCFLLGDSCCSEPRVPHVLIGAFS